MRRLKRVTSVVWGTSSIVLMPVPVVVGRGINMFCNWTSTGLKGVVLELIMFPGNGCPVAGLIRTVPAAEVAQLPPARKQLKSPLRSATVGWGLGGETD